MCLSLHEVASLSRELASFHGNTSPWSYLHLAAFWPFHSMSGMRLSSSEAPKHLLISGIGHRRRGFLQSTLPDSGPLWVIVALGNFTFSSCMRSATKIPNNVGLSRLPSGTPRRISTWLFDGMFGCRTRTFTTWNRFRRCFHIYPTILYLNSNDSNFPLWILGKAVE